MIRSVDIRGLRGIRNGGLDKLTPLVVLVGPNGCGKSTVMEALLIASANGIAEAIGMCVQRRGGIWNGVTWLFERGREDVESEWHVSASAVTGRSRRVVMAHIAPGTVQSIAFVKGSPNAPSAPAASIVNIAPNNSFKAQSDPTAIDPQCQIISAVRLVEPRLDPTQPALHRIYSAAAREGRRDEAESYVRDLVPRFSKLEILTAPESDTPEVNVVFDNGAVPLGLVGDGVQALVRQCLELAALKDGLALIEEPEAFKHPAAIRQTARAIVAATGRGVQVVLSTHSLEMIDALVAASSTDDALARMSLYRLALNDGTLSSTRLAGNEVKLLRSQIEEDLR